MSQENVEIVRRSYDAYTLGDIEGALAAIDPQIVIRDHDMKRPHTQAVASLTPPASAPGNPKLPTSSAGGSSAW